MRATVLTTALLAGALSALGTGAAAPRESPPSPLAGHPAFRPEVICAHYSDVTPPLRDMVPAGLPERESLEDEDELRQVPNRDHFRPRDVGEGAAIDPTLQNWNGREAMPSPLTSFDGQPNVMGYLPPDTQGDVGPNHYVQWVNVTLAVFSKTGQLLLGPIPGNTLWQGMGGPCDSCNDGDPIVLYDRYADRWLISQFVLPNIFTTGTGPFYQYVAVSTTPDPTGPWRRYWFQWSLTLMNDYPKIGIWPDGYYITFNQFDYANQGSFAGSGIVVLNRQAMLGGAAEGQVDGIRWDLGTVNTNYFSLLPAHLQGSNLPPAGSPCPMLELEADSLALWNVHVDWEHPGASTFGLDGQPDQAIPVSTFDYDLCGGARSCIRQPGTTSQLDALATRLMYRLHYRRFPTYDAMVVNHTVDADGTDHGGIRWYELRRSGGAWSLFQEGTYAPDGDSRWMGSANIDKMGNIALGYSVSSRTTFPSVRYAGRLAADPLGTLGQGEQSLVAGGGSQLASVSRWGDYSTLSVDPLDDCTFWYTTEYYATSSLGNWVTRIGSFRFPGCNRLSIDDIQAAPTSGSAPLTVAFVATATGVNVSYAWDFGDGATGTGATVTHTYLRVGAYRATLTITDGSSETVSAQAPEVTVTVLPPVPSSAVKMGNPFRVVVNGLNLQSGIQVFIGSDAQPWSQVQWKGATKIVLKGGSVLKAKIPKGQPALLTFVNPDGGSAPLTFQY